MKLQNSRAEFYQFYDLCESHFHSGVISVLLRWMIMTRVKQTDREELVNCHVRTHYSVLVVYPVFPWWNRCLVLVRLPSITINYRFLKEHNIKMFTIITITLHYYERYTCYYVISQLETISIFCTEIEMKIVKRWNQR